MGRVAVPAVIESLEDLYRAQRGEMPAERVRRIEVEVALVDTGATALSLPQRMVTQLGLLPIRSPRGDHGRCARCANLRRGSTDGARTRLRLRCYRGR